MNTTDSKQGDARETVCANCGDKLYQAANPNDIHWYHAASGNVRCPTQYAQPFRAAASSSLPAEPPQGYEYDAALFAFTEWWRGFCAMDDEDFPTDQKEVARAAFFAAIAYTHRTDPQDEGASTL